MDEDRVKHSLAVAKKMVEIGKEIGLDEEAQKELFVLGYNHDIGYQFGGNENHEKVGAEILKNNGYQYWKEVYYHGQVTEEFHSIYLQILNEADMQIDKSGNDVGYDKRLEDIQNRYGTNSNVYQKAKELVDYLKSCSID